jgi:hypothetical protein
MDTACLAPVKLQFDELGVNDIKAKLSLYMP